VAQLASSKTAIEFLPKTRSLSLYCAQGEVLVTLGGKTQRVESGETFRFNGSSFRVEPETAFEDWTLGLAVPWQTQKLSRSSLPEVWIQTEQGEPDQPLYTSRQNLDVVLDGEFARTRSTTEYFNGNDRTVTPTVRVALPPQAQLDQVRFNKKSAKTESLAALSTCKSEFVSAKELVGLEWSGNGWLTGKLPTITPGETIELILDYSEWHAIAFGEMTYRHPFAKGNDAPKIGEFSVSVDAQRADFKSLVANRGTTNHRGILSWRASDIRPSDDWVVSYRPTLLEENVARAYVETVPEKGEPFVLVRLETDARPVLPLRVGLVIDTSASVGLNGLELGRQLVEAVLGHLSPRDSALVIAADEEPRTIGVQEPASVTSDWKKRIELELSELRPGGASDLSRALEAAADKLDGASDRSRFNNAIVYLGDGKPTLGTLGMGQLRDRMMRRTSGSPKLSAVALGPAADVWQMAKLVSGIGNIHTATERAEASVVAATLVGSLQTPTFNDFRIDLGPEVDRIYPRDERNVAARTTVSVYGRLRGSLPNQVVVSYYENGQAKRRTFPLKRVALPTGGDVARRWAEQRLLQLIDTADGLKPAAMLAKEYGLLTPWSAWSFDAMNTSTSVSCTAFETRLVELSTLNDTPYAARIAPNVPTGSGWLEPPKTYDFTQSLEDAVKMQARLTVERARPAIVGCYNARVADNPALPNRLDFSMRILPNGRGENIRVVPSSGEPTDGPMLRCAERVLASFTYVGAKQPIVTAGTLTLPPPPNTKRSNCSTASRLPLELRLSVWQQRSGSPIDSYLLALHTCELPTWLDRRTILDGLLLRHKSISDRIDFARALRERGHTDAATHVERSTLARLTNLDELERARRLLLEAEPNVDALLLTQLKASKADEARLTIVRDALKLSPHSPLGRRLSLILLESLGKTADLRAMTDDIRRDPFADAGLLAYSAAALKRLGEDRPSRHAFTELFERAPYDPWVLAFAGDHLRHAGFHDESVSAYESLLTQEPDDTAHLLRLGLAQAQAGRVDIASRLLDRAAQIGGRTDDERLPKLSAIVKAVVLSNAREVAKTPTEREELNRRLAATPLPDGAAVVLVEIGERIEEELSIDVYRGPNQPAESPELIAAPLGLYGFSLEPGIENLKLTLTRRLLTPIARPLPVKVNLIKLGSQLLARKFVVKEATFAKDAERLDITLTEELRP
jgi:tetratricopeptide (TPR) repeat protein